RQFRPAINGHLVVPRVQADDDMPGKCDADVGDEMRFGHRARAEDDIVDADIQIGLDGGLIANAAADLYRHAGRGIDHACDQRLVDRPAGRGTVQIHDVDAVGTGFDPARDHGLRLVGEYGDVVHAALAQAHALAVLDIDGGDK